MNEYISRNDALLHSEIIRVYSKDYGNIDVVPVEYLADIPAAEVQTVDRWISVDDALPVYGGLVLVADKNSTIRLGMYTDLGWTSQFGNPMITRITHWQPLPEPPKASDAK